MSKSFQHEIPQARVNITLDVETGGAKTKKELPLKLLILGDFSNGKAKGTIAQRERISINKHNFNQVLADLSPELNINVPNRIKNDGDLPVKLQFQVFSDFKPEAIVEQIPQLKRLMAMRNLLKDLKSCVIDNQNFRKELEKIMRDRRDAQQLQQELSEVAPIIEEQDPPEN
ncbi:type VI secretion system contractile sheath small subunit [Legionella londiniensis]|uniref:type VI secretion system contractile sheath small subunit n=1 Tax=Legionella londiniensis TaxID=45068 RepID=UPI00399D3CCB